MTIYEALGQALVGILVVLAGIGAFLAPTVLIVWVVAKLGGSGLVAGIAVGVYVFLVFLGIMTAVAYYGA